MDTILSNVGFWFAVGIIVGVIIEFGGRLFFEWYFGPKLSISLGGLWRVETGATVKRVQYGTGSKSTHTDTVYVGAYRFKVQNIGRRAASNVAGTLEFDSAERRVCWYEGNTPTITINANDWSYLDVYGVILEQNKSSANSEYVTSNRIVMPTECGWNDLPPPKQVTERLPITVRVTAANAKRVHFAFLVDPNQECKPIATKR